MKHLTALSISLFTLVSLLLLGTLPAAGADQLLVAVGGNNPEALPLRFYTVDLQTRAQTLVFETDLYFRPFKMLRRTSGEIVILGSPQGSPPPDNELLTVDLPTNTITSRTLGYNPFGDMVELNGELFLSQSFGDDPGLYRLPDDPAAPPLRVLAPPAVDSIESLAAPGPTASSLWALGRGVLVEIDPTAQTAAPSPISLHGSPDSIDRQGRGSLFLHTYEFTDSPPTLFEIDVNSGLPERARISSGELAFSKSLPQTIASFGCARWGPFSTCIDNKQSIKLLLPGHSTSSTLVDDGFLDNWLVDANGVTMLLIEGTQPLPTVTVPTLGFFGLAALTLFLGLVGIAVLRRNLPSQS